MLGGNSRGLYAQLFSTLHGTNQQYNLFIVMAKPKDPWNLTNTAGMLTYLFYYDYYTRYLDYHIYGRASDDSNRSESITAINSCDI